MTRASSPRFLSFVVFTIALTIVAIGVAGAQDGAPLPNAEPALPAEAIGSPEALNPIGVVADASPIADEAGNDPEDETPPPSAIEQYGIWSWIMVAVIGAFVGITDLTGRYRDEPVRALKAPPAWIYVGVNVAAALIALWLILELDWTFDRPANQVALAQILVAGFGSILFMRTALFPIRKGGEEAAIGPAKVLEALLHTSDRGVDRIQAQARAKYVADLMKNTSFDRAAIELPLIALALMQNLSEDEQRVLEEQVAQLRSADQMDVSDEGKSLALGLMLVKYVGNDALRAAKEAVDAQIKLSPNQKPKIVAIKPAFLDPAQLKAAVDSGQSVELEVSGESFGPVSVVRLDGRAQPTTFIDEAFLTAQVRGADLASSTVHRVAVFTPAPGGGLSGALPLVIGATGPTGPTVNPGPGTTGGVSGSTASIGTTGAGTTAAGGSGPSGPSGTGVSGPSGPSQGGPGQASGATNGVVTGPSGPTNGAGPTGTAAVTGT